MARGAAWSLAGAVISRALNMVSFVTVARILGKVKYGEFGTIQSTVGMFGVFAGFGLGLTATRHVAQLRRSDPVRAGRIIALTGVVALATGVLMSGSLIVAAPWLATRTLAAPHLTGLLRISSALILLGALNSTQVGALAGFEAFRETARVNVLASLASLPMIVGSVFLWGIEGGLWALVVSTATTCLLNHVPLRRVSAADLVPSTVTDCWKEWPVLLSFALPTTLAGLLAAPVMWASNAIIVNTQNGYAEMGIYNAANQWGTMILFIPTALGAMIVPVLTQLHQEGRHGDYTRVLRNLVLFNGTVALTAAVAVILLSGRILRLYGPEFASGRPTLVLLALSAVVISGTNIVGQAIVSKGRIWIGVLLNVLWGSTTVALTWLLRDLGGRGMAMSIALAYLLHFLMSAAVVGRIVRVASDESATLGARA